MGNVRGPYNVIRGMSKTKRMSGTHQNVRTVLRPQTGLYKGAGEAKAGNKRRVLPHGHQDRTHLSHPQFPCWKCHETFEAEDRRIDHWILAHRGRG